MQCKTIHKILPELIGRDIPVDIASHISQCLRCQAEQAHYRSLKKALSELKSEQAVVDDTLFEDILRSVYPKSNVYSFPRPRKARLKEVGGFAAVFTAGLGAATLAFKIVNKQRLAG